MQHAHVNAEFFLRSTSTLRIQPDGSGECAEKTRLKEDEARKQNWKRWGPYLSERQWGTIREDYSAEGIRSLDIHVTRMKYIYISGHPCRTRQCARFVSFSILAIWKFCHNSQAAAGIISLMIKLVLEPIVGVKMVCLESPTVVHIRQLHAYQEFFFFPQAV